MKEGVGNVQALYSNNHNKLNFGKFVNCKVWEVFYSCFLELLVQYAIQANYTEKEPLDWNQLQVRLTYTLDYKHKFYTNP